MHELGVVFHVIDEVKEVAAENDIKHVGSVTIQLGKVSAVVPALLKDCWKWAVDREELMKGCNLTIEPIEAITFCEDCKQEYDTIKHGKTCPHCGSGNTYLLQGNEFMIKEIEVDD
ncbi:MAG: hydrogenase maturation nickel metallochaperone HypA [Lachnospiraceae bacterium]|nr:hydrogenase maturation nickel metallochaperone HypA [Lachnospiraceae bacterium]